jgi:hypothetical protein
MAKHGNHSIEFKRQVVQDYLGGETLYGLAKRFSENRCPRRRGSHDRDGMTRGPMDGGGFRHGLSCARLGAAAETSETKTNRQLARAVNGLGCVATVQDEDTLS